METAGICVALRRWNLFCGEETLNSNLAYTELLTVLCYRRGQGFLFVVSMQCSSRS